MWWTKQHWGKFFESTVSPATQSTNYSILIIIHHPSLVQYGKECPVYHVDSVPSQPKKLKKRREAVDKEQQHTEEGRHKH
jgi:hypothetical protein